MFPILITGTSLLHLTNTENVLINAQQQLPLEELSSHYTMTLSEEGVQRNALQHSHILIQ
jgi:hypothetical protein